jgi:hypothetical protein
LPQAEIFGNRGSSTPAFEYRTADSTPWRHGERGGPWTQCNTVYKLLPCLLLASRNFVHKFSIMFSPSPYAQYKIFAHGSSVSIGIVK